MKRKKVDDVLGGKEAWEGGDKVDGESNTFSGD